MKSHLSTFWPLYIWLMLLVCCVAILAWPFYFGGELAIIGPKYKPRSDSSSGQYWVISLKTRSAWANPYQPFTVKPGDIVYIDEYGRILRKTAYRLNLHDFDRLRAEHDDQ